MNAATALFTGKRLSSDEHCQLDDPQGSHAINQRLQSIPGHCDPTCSLYDWYVGIRDGKVETLWPVTARGKVF
jgi:3-hydroxy-D-aspartate aldolase